METSHPLRRYNRENRTRDADWPRSFVPRGSRALRARDARGTELLCQSASLVLFLHVVVCANIGRVLVIWLYQLTISYDADEEVSRIFENTQTVRSTVTEREAREGILREIAGDREWNERSPLVSTILKTIIVPSQMGAGTGHIG